MPARISFFVALLLTSSLGVVAPVGADTFWLPKNGDGVVGGLQGVVASFDETLLDIARLYNVGYEEIKLANPGVDPWIPGEGTLVVVPSRFVLPNVAREGIVLNLAEMRLYYYPKADASGRRKVVTHPVSIGQMDWRTPLGMTKISTKVERPTWYPPPSIRAEHEEMGEPLPMVVPPGPDNPLGDHALNLELRGYLIHGTNKPYGIGMRVSHGCIRMYPEDIAELFDDVPVGTPMHIVNQSIKVGWRDGVLYLEVHPANGELDLGGRPAATDAVRQVVAATSAAQAKSVRWGQVDGVVETMTGIPYAVSTPSVSLRLARNVEGLTEPRAGLDMTYSLALQNADIVELRMSRALVRWPYYMENSRVQ